MIFNERVARWCRARNRVFYYHGVVKVTILASSYRALFYSSVTPRVSTKCELIFTGAHYDSSERGETLPAFIHRCVYMCNSRTRSTKSLTGKLYSGILRLAVPLSLLLSSFLTIFRLAMRLRKCTQPGSSSFDTLTS